MSIIVNLACGLANRMFQYSYYTYLKDRGYDVFTDSYDSGKLAHETVAWNSIFKNAELKQANKFYVWAQGGGQDNFSRARRKYLKFSTNVFQMPSAFDALLPTKNNQYIIGVFQNGQMVEIVKNKVFELFQFEPFRDKMNLGLEKEMEDNNSVAIHVRKGKDYQERIWYQNTCEVEYYKKAIDYMLDNLNNPKFYVFTDNKDWVKHNFGFFDYFLVDGNPPFGYGSHFDMQLMTHCHHNIISNSTYSWWGAFLNRHESKTVIIPEIWFNPDSCEEFSSSRLRCNGWISI